MWRQWSSSILNLRNIQKQILSSNKEKAQQLVDITGQRWYFFCAFWDTVSFRVVRAICKPCQCFQLAQYTQTSLCYCLTLSSLEDRAVFLHIPWKRLSVEWTAPFSVPFCTIRFRRTRNVWRKFPIFSRKTTLFSKRARSFVNLVDKILYNKLSTICCEILN